MTTRDALLFHSVERLLEKLQVRRAACFFAGIVDPLFLERIFGRAIGLIKHAEDAGER